VGDPTTTRRVDSRLAYDFFDGLVPREPTDAEVSGLIVQTNMFFSQLLAGAYPESFVSFTAEDVDSSFTAASANYPIRVDFDAAVVFNTEDEDTPSEMEIFNVMDNSNRQDYIQMYVWQSEVRKFSWAYYFSESWVFSSLSMKYTPLTLK
jgi:hypothetical protein